MSQSAISSRPLVAWMDVLDQIDQSLSRSLAAAQALEPLPEVPEPPSSLKRLEERLTAWQARLDTAGRQASLAEERLRAEQVPLQGWVEKLALVKQSFADWLQNGAAPAAS